MNNQNSLLITKYQFIIDNNTIIHSSSFHIIIIIHNKISKQSQRRFEINNRYIVLVNSEKQAFLGTHEYVSV